jgi:YHS domain-containing protein
MAKARDPICGMSVETEGARFKGRFGGETVYFCCEPCLKAYAARHPAD